jgi:hypothetical protein
MACLNATIRCLPVKFLDLGYKKFKSDPDTQLSATVLRKAVERLQKTDNTSRKRLAKFPVKKSFTSYEMADDRQGVCWFQGLSA